MTYCYLYFDCLKRNWITFDICAKYEDMKLKYVCEIQILSLIQGNYFKQCRNVHYLKWLAIPIYTTASMMNTNNFLQLNNNINNNNNTNLKLSSPCHIANVMYPRNGQNGTCFLKITPYLYKLWPGKQKQTSYQFIHRTACSGSLQIVTYGNFDSFCPFTFKGIIR